MGIGRKQSVSEGIPLRDKPVVYAFSHGNRALLRENTPAISAVWSEGLVVGYSNGTLRVYESSTSSSYRLLSHIEFYKSGNALRQQIQPLIAALDVCASNVDGKVVETLVVAYGDGSVVLFALKTGRQLARSRMRFRPKGMDTSFKLDSILVWGYSCTMVLLDRETLNIKMEWQNLKDWPIPVPLFDNRILLMYNDGESEQYVVRNGTREPLRLKEQINFELRQPNKGDDGHFHNFDMVVAVKRVGPISWLVVQRNGWSLYRWQEETLVNEISSDSSATLMDVVSAPYSESQECFGVVGNDGKVVWVNDGSVQIIDPAWDDGDVLVQVMHLQDLLQAVVLDRNGIKVYQADTRVSPVSWAKDIAGKILDTFHVGPKYVSAVHDKSVLIAYDRHLTLYTVPEFLQKFDKLPSSLELEESDQFTVIKSSTVPDAEHIVTGTKLGRLLLFDKSSRRVLHSLQLFATPVDRIFSIPKMNFTGKFSGNIIAVSNHSTVAVVDLYSGSKQIITGNNVTIQRLRIVSLSGQCGLSIQYESGETRIWNVVTGSEVLDHGSEFDDTGITLNEAASGSYLIPINSDTQVRPPDPVLLISMDQFLQDYESVLEDGKLDHDGIEVVRAIAASLIQIPEGESSKSWHKELTIGSDVSQVRIGQVDMNSSFMSISEVIDSGLLSEGPASAYIVSVWVLLVRALLRSLDMQVESHGKLLHWLRDVSKCHNPTIFEDLSGFATLVTTTSSLPLRRTARLCLKELVKASEDTSDSQDALLTQWQPLLPVVAKEGIYDEASLQSLEILASFAISRSKSRSTLTQSDKAQLRDLAREIAESLQLYLTFESPEENRDTAIELVGRGWSIWQAHLNPFSSIDMLVQILYREKYTAPRTQEQRKTTLIVLTQRCIQEIATQNVALLISALVTKLGSADEPLDARATSIRIISNLISSTQHFILPEHLPTIISAIVKTLDPSDATLREPAPIGGTSIIAESTQFLSGAMSKHPDYLAFHKAQQRLAVSTTGSLSLLALVYDLRTGTVVASLAVQKQDNISLNSRLTKLKFSPDGKKIAGLVSSEDEPAVHVAVWKLGFEIMSLLQTFSLNNTKEGEGTSVFPYQITAVRSETFNWTSANELTFP